MRDFLFQKIFFILGDSAYALDSLMIPPFESPPSCSQEDDFDLFHSSTRITVECAFGEIDLRWGILWKRLTCSLENTTTIIEGAMRLHNFLVDYREDTNYGHESLCEKYIFENEYADNGINSMVIGNDSVRPAGRISTEDQLNRQKGILLRDNLKSSLVAHYMHLPRKEEN